MNIPKSEEKQRNSKPTTSHSEPSFLLVLLTNGKLLFARCEKQFSLSFSGKVSSCAGGKDYTLSLPMTCSKRKTCDVVVKFSIVMRKWKEFFKVIGKVRSGNSHTHAYAFSRSRENENFSSRDVTSLGGNSSRFKC